jgi:hypothetical protein
MRPRTTVFATYRSEKKRDFEGSLGPLQSLRRAFGTETAASKDDFPDDDCFRKAKRRARYRLQKAVDEAVKSLSDVRPPPPTPPPPRPGPEEDALSFPVGVRRKWTAEQDAVLMEAHARALRNTEVSPQRPPWKAIADDLVAAGVAPCTPRQAKERYMLHLREGIDKTPLREDEVRFVREWIASRGTEWAKIARALGNGRTDNFVKNQVACSMDREHARRCPGGASVVGETRSQKRRREHRDAIAEAVRRRRVVRDREVARAREEKLCLWSPIAAPTTPNPPREDDGRVVELRAPVLATVVRPSRRFVPPAHIAVRYVFGREGPENAHSLRKTWEVARN